MSHRSGDAGRGGGRGPAAAGRRDLQQPRVRGPRSRCRGHHRGQVRPVNGKDILVVTGRFGFKTYDVSDAGEPGPPQHVHARGHRNAARFRRQGYWQDEDMELDTKRNLIIGALDPRHNDQDPAATGCPERQHRRPRPGLQERLLRDLLQRPGEPAPGRRLRVAARRAYGELHPGLQVHLDRGPARRSDQDNLGPIITPGAGAPERAEPADRRRPADLGHRPARPGQAGRLGRADRPVAQRRLHGLLARRRRGRAGHRLGRRSRRPPRLRHLAAGTATRTRTGSAGRRRSTRSSSPAAAWPGTTRPCRATTAPRSP